MKKYDHIKIEKKWQGAWKKSGIYKTTEAGNKPKSYVLDMFPYPSGTGLHVGHPKGYIATDIYSRFKTMSGFNVLHPMGWDAFGLPAEEFAIKNKIHPEVAVKKNVKRYKEQLSILGFNYDWSREINTTDPEYYKWTQWTFLQMFKKGLVYQSHEPINWCPSCKTGLANEDLENGKCERCGSVIEKRAIPQWVIKITDYADRMLKDLELLKDWPESVKISQKNWIGRSEGMLFTSPVKDTDLKIQTFSAHFEAFKADTFVVIAPDHPFLPALVKGSPKEKEVLEFSKKLVEKRAAAGHAEDKNIEGIFTGRYTVDPVGNGDLPIWVASFALADYGTGIVKCSAHDERDFAFAKKYKLPLKAVLFPENKEEAEKVAKFETCYFDMKNGILREPKEFDSRRAGEVKQEIITYLEKNNLAVRKKTYRLKDWVFSRQRYWGEPIPLIHCPNCGVVAVPEKELPLKLPKVKFYEPTGTGESPLAAIEKWVNVKCPNCKGKARRETNTMPQWAGSSWYYLRYADSKNKKALIDPKKEKYWQPVDMYVGGAEHATRHLIYARFWHKFLFDIGVVTTPEPFMRLKNVGLIAGPDGRKMSKRFGNVVNPDDIVKLYGADTLRVYEAFMGPFEQGIAWSTDNMAGSRRFIEKVWRLAEKVQLKVGAGEKPASLSSENEALIHRTVKKVGEDIEAFAGNTAVSALMIMVNAMEKETAISKKAYETLLKLLAPFAPHVTDELWAEIGSKKSIHLEEWPIYDPKKLASGVFKIVVQINSKVRAIFESDTDEESKVVEKALALPEIASKLSGKKPEKTIYVKGKLVNLVVAL